MPALTEDLADLTGEEIYNLVAHMDSQIDRVCAAPRKRPVSEDDTQALNRLVIDLIEIRQAAMMQVCRISVSFKEAQGIIWRAVYARGHPVRVPGT